MNRPPTGSGGTLTSSALRERLRTLPERRRRAEVRDAALALLVVLSAPSLAVLAGLALELAWRAWL